MLTSVQFSPQGDAIATASHDQTIKLWHSPTGKCLQTMPGHTNWIWGTAFHPHGEMLASASQDQTIRLWNVASGKCLHTMKSPRPYEAMNITNIQGLTSHRSHRSIPRRN